MVCLSQFYCAADRSGNVQGSHSHHTTLTFNRYEMSGLLLIVPDSVFGTPVAPFGKRLLANKSLVASYRRPESLAKSNDSLPVAEAIDKQIL